MDGSGTERLFLIRIWLIHTWSEGNAVALGVEESANLDEVAVALNLVLDGVGLHEEGVVAV